MSSVHYIPGVRNLTVDLWLSGKTHEEIRHAIYTHLAKNRRSKSRRAP